MLRVSVSIASSIFNAKQYAPQSKSEVVSSTKSVSMCCATNTQRARAAIGVTPHVPSIVAQPESHRFNA